MKMKIKRIMLSFVLSIVSVSAMDLFDDAYEAMEAVLAPRLYHYKQVADVSFEIREGNLIGREKGKDVFRYKVSNFNDCAEYTGGNFAITKLGDELRWRYMSPDEKFCEVSVNANGDMELLETPQSNTTSGIFLFKTNGTLVNRGSQAFSFLILSAEQFHNYGTLQTLWHHFYHNYSFNSGVIKSDELPMGIADLRTPDMKYSTARPNYRKGIIDNYGKEIYSGTLQIKGALSQDEHGESVFENFIMDGGDIVVNGGSMNISGKLSGTVRNMSSTCQGSLYVNEYDATRTGNYFAAGGSMYTTAANCNNLAQYAKDLNDEQRLLEKFQNARRVTPEQAYERYQLIKQGKENQLYSAYTVGQIKRAHPNDWKAIMAMNEWGLQGGGHSFERHVIRPVLKGGPIAAVGAIVPPLAPVAYGLAAGVVVHEASGGRAPVSFGVDHRGNMAAGYGPGSVDYQLTNQRRAQDRQTNQIRDTFGNTPYMPLPRNKNHPYWKELEETLPQKVKLAKDLQLLLKPVNQYYSWNHKSYIYGTYKCLDNPLNIIKNAYNMKVDTTKYWENRNYFSNLYKSMTSAGIQHTDILAVWGNPYIGTITKWNELSWQRKQNLKLQYPEMEKLAEDIAEQKRNFYDILRNNIYSPAQRFLDEYAFAISAIASITPYGRTYSVVRGAVAVVPKLGQLITTLGSVELARQFQILYKKNSDGNSIKPRVQATRTDADKYLNGLKNQGVLGKKGVTKDGYDFFKFIRNCEYKGIKFKKGEYISRDKLHNEWEHFTNPKKHTGAIDPLTGKLDISRADSGRTLRLP